MNTAGAGAIFGLIFGILGVIYLSWLTRGRK